MTPAFQVFVAGVDITGRVNDRLIRLVVTDNDGVKSDDVTIVLDDRDFALGVPRKGALIAVSMGYVETGLAPMGLFTASRVQRRFDKSGGATMEITGKSADLKKEMKSQRHGSYIDKTIGDIVNEISGRHGLGAIVSQKLAQLKRTPEYQSEESDLNFLTRLAKDHDAVFKVAGGKFVFLGRDEIVLPAVVIRKGDLSECTVEADDRAEHKKARAHYHKKGETKREAEEDDGAAEGGEFTLRHPFASKEVAEACAKAKKRQLERAAKTIQGKGPGNVRIMAGVQLVTVIGGELYDGTWRCRTATHEITKQGYSTQFDGGTEEKSGGGAGGGSGG